MDADPDPSYQEKFTKGVMLAPTLKIIVGIDFGTSNIGVAFRTIASSPIVGVEVGDRQLKWPMCVVLEKAPPHKLVAIGPDSINIMHTRGVESLGMFRKFKMALHEGFEQSEIQADVGDFKVPAKILFAHCFTKLGEMVRASILNAHNIQLDDTANTVAWVLTVPGIWTDKAKQFMRRAMYDAGLISEENSRNLHIVLEPESAALDVLRTVPFVQTKGTKFLLVDCGGGTIDCAGYEVLMMSPGDDGAVKLIEQFKSGGGPWGGTFVDAAFEKFLIEFFGDRGAQVIKPGSLALFELMMGEWEKAKCTFAGQNELAVNFTAVIGDVDGVSLDELIAAYRAKHPEYAGLRRSPGSNARVLLPLNLVMSFFAEPLERFSEYLEKLLQNVSDLNFVVGVGGFCQSPVLQRTIESICDKFKDVKARFPPRPSMAIVQGAVHTGVHIIKHQTTPVSERVVRRSYGVETSATFINGMFPDDRKRWDGSRGEFMVDKVFKPLVLAGDRASLDARKSCRLVPMYPDQDVVSINFFHCPQRDAKFITDAGVEPLGQVEMPVAKLQDLPAGASREVAVYLNFGLSELVAMVICKHTGESKRVIMKLPDQL